MASRMIRCPYCKRYVPLVQKGYRIYCPDCGREITYSEKGDENVSPRQQENYTRQHPDSISGDL